MGFPTYAAVISHIICFFIDERFARKISENIETLPFCKMKLSIIYQCMLVLEDKSRLVEYVKGEKFVKEKQNEVLLALIEEEVLRF